MKVVLPLPDKTIVDSLRFEATRKISGLLKLFGYRYKHLMVCGYPRSGTSLLYNMLAAGLKTEFKFTKFEKYYMHYIHKLGNIATKAPMDILYLQHLRSLNIHRKQMIVLVLIRDIREIVTSKHPMLPDEYFIGYDNSYWPKDESFDAWDYSAPGVLEISKEIRSIQCMEGVTLIKYEELTSKPDEIQERISDIYGMHFGCKFSEYFKEKDNLPYSYTGYYAPKDESLVLEASAVQHRESRWSRPEHRQRILQQFKSCPDLFDLLVEYGYESDRSWFDKFSKEVGV